VGWGAGPLWPLVGGGWSCAVFAVRGVGWGVVMAVGGGGVVVRRVRGWWGGV
jgi:hypothetical protein